jgi:membrane fusion protein, heavy metal efflux system
VKTRGGLAGHTPLRAMVSALLVISVAVSLGVAYFAGSTKVGAQPEDRSPSGRSVPGGGVGPQYVELSERQTGSLKIGPAESRNFEVLKTAVGTIDFNENMLVQVFSQYPGKISKAFFNLGDEVKQSDILFTIDSPDLLQAESALLASAGVLELQTRILATRLLPISKRRKATSRRPRMRSGSSEKPTPKSSRSSRKEKSTPRCWCQARFREKSSRVVRLQAF